MGGPLAPRIVIITPTTPDGQALVAGGARWIVDTRGAKRAKIQAMSTNYYVLILDFETDAVRRETMFVDQADAFEHARYEADQADGTYVLLERQVGAAKREIIERSDWI